LYQQKKPDTTEETQLLWRHLFGGQKGLLQIWSGVKDECEEFTSIKSNYFSYPGAAKDAAEWALEKAGEPEREVYFCVHLLNGPQRTKENASEVITLWGELDGVPVPNGELKPSAIVQSSPGRYHCYWRLTDAIPPQIAEQLNNRIAKKIGADPSGFDLSQLLRVPGTVNHKYEEKPTVQLLTVDGSLCCNPGDLDRMLPELPEDTDEYEPADDSNEPPVALGPESSRTWQGENPKLKDDGSGEIDRSSSLMKIARVLFDAGANRRIIVESTKERDITLGWHKYSGNRDGGEKEYERIYTKLKREGRNTYAESKIAGNNDNDDNDFRFDGLPEPLEFPLAALPPSTKQFVREGAASLGCAVDFVGHAVLAALAAAIGDSRRVVLKRDWAESAAIYAMLIGPPGSKKSPAINLVLGPIRARQLALKTEYERQKEEYETQVLDHKKAIKDGPVSLPKPEKPTMGRTWVDDTTVERLADILAENRRGILLAKDELSGWLAAMNQYKQGGKGSDRQFWLSAHDNSPTLVDRKYMEEPQLLGRPFVAILGGMQPSVLPDFGKDRIDGLMERFTPVYPNPVVSEWTEDEVSGEAHERYSKTIGSLYRLKYTTLDRGEFPLKVYLTDEAKKLFVAEYNKLVREAAMPGFPERLAAVWSKLPGRLARLALIISTTRIVELKNKEEFAGDYVIEEDMRGAISLLRYFENHIRRIYMGLYRDNPEDKLAADLYAFLAECGGVWEGIASELHAALDSDHKPKREEELGKMLRAIVRRYPAIRLEEGRRTKDRRPFKLLL
jgi:hypothetical protein